MIGAASPGGGGGGGTADPRVGCPGTTGPRVSCPGGTSHPTTPVPYISHTDYLNPIVMKRSKVQTLGAPMHLQCILPMMT